MAAVRDHHVGRRHRAGVGEPRHEHRVGRHRDRRIGLAAVVGGDHAHRRPRQPGERRAQHAVLGVLRGRGRHEHDRAVSRRRRDALARRLPEQRADDAQPRLPAPRVLELRQRGDERQRAREPRVQPRQRREPEPRAAVVVLAPALLEALVDGALEAAPEPGSRARARKPRAERVGREAGGRPRVHVRHQGRERHAAELGGQRGRGREDVRDRDVGRERLDRRDRLAGGMDGRLVGLQRPLAGGEDLVLRRGGELDPGRLRRLLPAAPGLQRDGVAAVDERLAEREHRERVAGIAERAEVDAQGPTAHSCLRYATSASPSSSFHCSRPSWRQPDAS